MEKENQNRFCIKIQQRDKIFGAVDVGASWPAKAVARAQGPGTALCQVVARATAIALPVLEKACP